MRPGSVIVDLAVERGGNVRSWRKPGEIGDDAQRRQDRRPPQCAGPARRVRLRLYARNLYAFVETLSTRPTKDLAVKWDDELVKATCLTRDGAVVHPAFQPKA